MPADCEMSVLPNRETEQSSQVHKMEKHEEVAHDAVEKKQALILTIAFRHDPNFSATKLAPYVKTIVENGKVIVDNEKMEPEFKKVKRSDSSSSTVLGYMSTGQRLVLTNCPMRSPSPISNQDTDTDIGSVDMEETSKGPTIPKSTPHTKKTPEELKECAAKIPEKLTRAERKEYRKSKNREVAVRYSRVTRKGELFNEHPEPYSERIYFNKQVKNRDLADLRDRCTPYQFAEIHGLFPKTPLRSFQHDKTDTKPTCYFVHRNEGHKLFVKYEDALEEFKEIESHSGRYSLDM
ncbi:hypothetical protein CAEBREN_11942 [Caenorhabditis brenneri]|uniref:Uncharacterized protein n=1 Tax=Caenorhabditis brenneri TaxID=135651 RepID=G0M7J8_CAEBE|nr:hypothetical protein CAEBREN_11942 [Caenorhabditis brenneri]